MTNSTMQDNKTIVWDESRNTIP